MWVFEQANGCLWAADGTLVGTGYSGSVSGGGKNNPAVQGVKDVGPIPEGTYTIGAAYDHPKLGQTTMDLTPDPTNEMFGRDLFRIHGDAPDHDASEGCIVQPHGARMRVAGSTDRRLRVVAESEPRVQ